VEISVLMGIQGWKRDKSDYWKQASLWPRHTAGHCRPTSRAFSFIIMEIRAWCTMEIYSFNY